jgi:hypothetical protein
LQVPVAIELYDAILAEKLRREAKGLVDGITEDECGSLVGGQWMGGHGGLLSRSTIAKADAVRTTLGLINKRLAASTCSRPARIRRYSPHGSRSERHGRPGSPSSPLCSASQ